MFILERCIKEYLYCIRPKLVVRPRVMIIVKKFIRTHWVEFEFINQLEITIIKVEIHLSVTTFINSKDDYVYTFYRNAIRKMFEKN